ncbi:hypothetical protein HMN09_00193300 [Mycena chlorophos]|uniref:F-box domain-containing protein n=1 Tax=Mycena chlorophos TaxID=658473 RepID=A0A8H6WJM9_MYCCL|nr:hypothetical protein HMN09_00193300 [Mycena chlorophos]
MSLPADLPQEIFDAIIGHVPATDSATLKASAAVCTSFNVPSRRRLFHSIRLYRLRALQHPTLEETAALFAASPVLTTYIRDLTVEISDVKDDVLPLVEILTKIAADGVLERFVVAGKTAKWSAVATTAPEFNDAFFAILQMPTLQRLHLMFLNHVPTKLFTLAFAVPVVSFSQVLVRKDTDLNFDERLDESTPSPVRHLIVADAVNGGALPVYECFLRAPPKGVKRLDIRLTQDDNHYESRLLAACSGSLEELRIDAGELTRQPTYTWPTLTYLHTLVIKLMVNRNRQLPAVFLPFLSILSSNNLPALHTLTLQLVLEARYPKEEPAWDIPEPASTVGSLGAKRIRCKLLIRDLPSVLDPRDDSELWENFEKAMLERLFPSVPGGVIQYAFSLQRRERVFRFVDRPAGSSYNWMLRTQRRTIVTWTSPVLHWGKKRLERPPIPLPPTIQTFDSRKLTPDHFITISDVPGLRGEYRVVSDKQLHHPQAAQFGNQVATKNTFFPPEASGFLYFRSPPEQHPFAGALRFRVAEGPSREAFLGGRDLLSPHGLPWEIPVWEMATLRDYTEFGAILKKDQFLPDAFADSLTALKVVRDSNFITALGQPFLTNLNLEATRLYICEPKADAFPVPFMVMHPWFVRKVSGHSPFNGKALCSIIKNPAFTPDSNPVHEAFALRINKVVGISRRLRDIDPRYHVPRDGLTTPLSIWPIIRSTKLKKPKMRALIPSFLAPLWRLPQFDPNPDILQVYQHEISTRSLLRSPPHLGEKKLNATLPKALVVRERLRKSQAQEQQAHEHKASARSLVRRPPTPIPDVLRNLD